MEQAEKALNSGRVLSLETEYGELWVASPPIFAETLPEVQEPLLLLDDYGKASEWVEVAPDCAPVWARYPMGPLLTRLRPLKVECRRLKVTVPFQERLRELLGKVGALMAEFSGSGAPPCEVLRVEGFAGRQLGVTELDLSGSLRYVRQVGFISARELGELVSGPLLLTAEQPTPQRFTRFRPEARVVVVEGEPERVRRRLKMLRESYSVNENLLLLVSQEAEDYFEGGEVRCLGSLESPAEYGEKLFETLEELENEEESWIVLIEGLPREGEGLPVMERLGLFAEKMINTENPGFSGLGVVDGETPAGEQR